MGMKARTPSPRVSATVYPFRGEAPVHPAWKGVFHRAYEAFLVASMVTGGVVAVYFLIYEPIARHVH